MKNHLQIQVIDFYPEVREFERVEAVAFEQLGLNKKREYQLLQEIEGA